jgi:hypothetical protein
MSEPRGLGCIATISAFFVGCVFGGVICGILVRLGADSLHYHNRYLEERDAVELAIQKDRAFRAVQIYEKSDGGIFMDGDVPTAADLERFRKHVTNAIGETRAREAMLCVHAKDEKARP